MFVKEAAVMQGYLHKSKYNFFMIAVSFLLSSVDLLSPSLRKGQEVAAKRKLIK